MNFMSLYPDFYSKINSTGISFTNTELTVLSFVKLNFSTQDTADIMSVSYKAIEKHRTNIRKKLEIHKSENLTSIVNKMIA